MDKKSPATLARLARQTATMYGEVSALFNAPALTQHFERSWVSHTQMKVRAVARARVCVCVCVYVCVCVRVAVHSAQGGGGRCCCFVSCAWLLVLRFMCMAPGSCQARQWPQGATTHAVRSRTAHCLVYAAGRVRRRRCMMCWR
jgi:hypothetical protein